MAGKPRPGLPGGAVAQRRRGERPSASEGRTDVAPPRPGPALGPVGATHDGAGRHPPPTGRCARRALGLTFRWSTPPPLVRPAPYRPLRWPSDATGQSPPHTSVASSTPGFGSHQTTRPPDGVAVPVMETVRISLDRTPVPVASPPERIVDASPAAQSDRAPLLPMGDRDAPAGRRRLVRRARQRRKGVAADVVRRAPGRGAPDRTPTRRPHRRDRVARASRSLRHRHR
jgi:hypothetical protein